MYSGGLMNHEQDILVPFIESVVDSLTHCIQSSLAKRAFKQCFPRLGLRENLESGWEQNAEAMITAIVRLSCYLLSKKLKLFLVIP